MNCLRLPKLLLLLFLVCSSAIAFAQEKTISGKVNDQTGKPLEGVSVKVKNTQTTTMTNENGEYTIKVPSTESILSFSYVGFSIYETKAGTDATLTISMTPIDIKMNEVVIVGYGSRKRANVLGSVATINPKEVEDLPVANLATALVNKVPGVSITQSSGKPGSSTALKIRNPVTFSQNSPSDPLYVIDGLQLTKEDFDNLDATMVESITFLKDAAASIYGSRGANGVVLVTTKRGRPGKPRVSYSGSVGVSTAAQRTNTLSAFEHVTALNAKYLSRPAWNYLAYTQQEIDYAAGNDNDWFDQTWEDAYLSRHTINVSGGSDKITFFGGANYLKETGNLSDLYATRYGFRIGLNAKITDNLSADIAFGNDNAIQNRPTPKGIAAFAGQNSDQNDQLNATIGALMLMPKWVPTYIDGKPVFTTAPGWHPDEVQNTGTYARTKSEGQTMNVSLSYKVPFIKGLTARVQYGRNTRSSLGKEYYVSYNLYDFQRTNNSPLVGSGITKQAIMFTNLPTASNPIRPIKNGNSLRNATDNAKSYQFNQSLNYKTTFGKHDLDILVLAEQSESDASSFFASVEGQVIPNVDEFWGFTTDRAFFDHASSGSETGRASYLGRVNYSYNDRYLFEGVLRADASPNFPPGSRWGYFPSVALGWKISQENFFRNIKFVDDLKIRYQVGLTGNDVVTNYRYYERFSQTTGYLFGGTQTNGLNNNVIPNPNITWGKSLYYNFGLDGSVFNRRFDFAIDIYKRKDRDMLEQPNATTPTTLGIAVAENNYSKLDSWGLEGALNYNGTIGKEFKFNIGVNVGWTDNKVIRKYFAAASDTGYKYPIGRRTDSGIEGYRATEIFRSQSQVDAFYAKNPGWLINGDSLRVGYLNYEDINGDGRITDLDRTRIANRSGSLWGLGFNLGFSWKGFRLNVNTSLSVGGSRTYDNSARRPPTENQSALGFWKDTWSPINTDARFPVINAPLISEVSSFWVVSGTSMRINNAQLSYTLPQALRTKFKIPELRIFVVGTNLWNIINNQWYKDLSTNVAVDYPALRTFTFGANLSL